MDTPAFLASLARRSPDLRGKVSVGWKVMQRLDRQGQLSGEWHLSVSDGSRFVLPRQSRMAWVMAFRGAYDAEFQELVAQHVERDTLVLDIGASLGLWTVYLARRAETEGAHVWAFEPHPNNHPWLHRNIWLNDLGSIVTVHETALGDEAGTVMMNGGEAGLSGGGGNSAVAVAGAREGVSVSIVELDSIPRPARVSVIKIDVEGYEVRVLRGATRLIEHDRPVIFGEFNEVWLRQRGEDLGKFLDGIRDSGYEIFAVDQLRTRAWRSTDTTRLRLLARGQVAENLLLRPLRER